MSSLHRDDVTELRAALKAAALLQAAVPRVDLLERAVEGLSDEQIEAIPRLIAWFTSPLPDDADEAVADYAALEALFPLRPQS